MLGMQEGVQVLFFGINLVLNVFILKGFVGFEAAC